MCNQCQVNNEFKNWSNHCVPEWWGNGEDKWSADLGKWKVIVWTCRRHQFFKSSMFKSDRAIWHEFGRLWATWRGKAYQKPKSKEQAKQKSQQQNFLFTPSQLPSVSVIVHNTGTNTNSSLPGWGVPIYSCLIFLKDSFFLASQDQRFCLWEQNVLIGMCGILHACNGWKYGGRNSETVKTADMKWPFQTT